MDRIFEPSFKQLATLKKDAEEGNLSKERILYFINAVEETFTILEKYFQNSPVDLLRLTHKEVKE